MKWLLSKEDFNAAVGNGADWMFEVLWDNGIISESDAIIQFTYASTDFDVPDCPFCGANDNRHYPLADKRWKCKKCRKKFSLTSGRYLDNSKMPITYWWRFCYLVGNSKIINSSAIARDLGITQKSAWLMLNTLRQSLKDSGVEIKNSSIDLESNWDVMRLLMRVKRTL